MAQIKWFQSRHLKSAELSTIVVDDLQGYVLPHAGTEYTGDIISHTMRFRPSVNKKIKDVYIFYYPANEEPDTDIAMNDTNEDHTIISSCLMKSSTTKIIPILKCHHELF